MALEGYRICVAPDPVDEVKLEAFLQAQVDRSPNAQMQCIPAVLSSINSATTSSPTYLEELQALGHRTLVIHGTGDLAVAADGGERLSELIPQSRFMPIEKMGHFPLDQERWATIADAVIVHTLRS